LPILRVSWRVTGDGESCFSNLMVNGIGLDGDLWDNGIQGTRCGEGAYARETALSLRDVFGNNIPSQVTVSARLTRQRPVGFTSEELDTASAVTTTRECEAGFTP
jgi:hypothetical protein